MMGKPQTSRAGNRDDHYTTLFPADKVILAQTDTTVGLLSQDALRLSAIKERPQEKPFLKVYSDLAHLKTLGGRVPKSHRSRIRRAKRSTFVIQEKAIRVVHDSDHHRLLKHYGWLFSTSANQSGHGFEQSFCEAAADVIIEDARGLFEGRPSSIIRLGKTRQRRLR